MVASAELVKAPALLPPRTATQQNKPLGNFSGIKILLTR